MKNDLIIPSKEGSSRVSADFILTFTGNAKYQSGKHSKKSYLLCQITNDIFFNLQIEITLIFESCPEKSTLEGQKGNRGAYFKIVFAKVLKMLVVTLFLLQRTGLRSGSHSMLCVCPPHPHPNSIPSSVIVSSPFTSLPGLSL